MIVNSRYNNYLDFKLDMAVFQSVILKSQIDLEEYRKEILRELEQEKPLKTFENLRYQLSDLVSTDYVIEYNNEVSLQENELLVDFDDIGGTEDYDVADELDLDMEEVEDVKSRCIINPDTSPLSLDKVQEINNAYSLFLDSELEEFNGNISELERRIQELSDSLEYKEEEQEEESEEIESDEPILNPEKVELKEEIIDFSEGSDDSSYAEVDISDIGYSNLGGNDNEEEKDEVIDENNNGEDAYDEEEEEVIDESNNEDYTYDEEEEDDYDDEEDEYTEEEDEYTEEEDEYTEEDVEDTEEETEEDEYDEEDDEELYYGVEDEEEEETYDEEEETYVEEEEIDEEDENNESEKLYTENEENTNDTDKTEEDDIENYIINNEEVNNTGVEENKVNSDSKNKESLDNNINVNTLEEEPKDLIQFIRKHPRCEISFALKYFSKKEIEKNIMMGRIIKKGNKLYF